MSMSGPRWRQATVRVWQRISPEDVQIRAAGVAFYAFLALLPGMLAVVMLFGSLADPDHVKQQLAMLAPLFPPDVAEFLGGQLVDMTYRSNTSLRISAAASACFGIWGASKGIRALLHTLGTRAPGGDPRGRVGRGVRALALAISAVVVVVLAVATMIVVPAVLAALGRAGAATWMIRLLRWPVLALAVFSWLALLYRARPAQQQTPWRWTLLGAAVATGLWLLGSVAFSAFVARFRKEDILYGSLAAAVLLLTWFLLASYAVLLGAEVADAARATAKTTTARPSGEPGVRRHPSAGTPQRSR
jgi:membrane protein